MLQSCLMGWICRLPCLQQVTLCFSQSSQSRFLIHKARSDEIHVFCDCFHIFISSSPQGFDFSVTQLINNRAIFTAVVLTCHSRKSTCLIININNGSLLFKCPCKPAKSHYAQYHGPITKAARIEISHHEVYYLHLC